MTILVCFLLLSVVVDTAESQCYDCPDTELNATVALPILIGVAAVVFFGFGLCFFSVRLPGRKDEDGPVMVVATIVRQEDEDNLNEQLSTTRAGRRIFEVRVQYKVKTTLGEEVEVESTIDLLDELSYQAAIDKGSVVLDAISAQPQAVQLSRTEESPLGGIIFASCIIGMIIFGIGIMATRSDPGKTAYILFSVLFLVSIASCCLARCCVHRHASNMHKATEDRDSQVSTDDASETELTEMGSVV